MSSITLVGYGVLSVVVSCSLIYRNGGGIGSSLFSVPNFALQYGYYLPILFQSVQGVSTTESGIRFIALVGAQIFAIVVTGALVSRWGYYVS